MNYEVKAQKYSYFSKYYTQLQDVISKDLLPTLNNWRQENRFWERFETRNRFNNILIFKPLEY